LCLARITCQTLQYFVSRAALKACKDIVLIFSADYLVNKPFSIKNPPSENLLAASA
jgi:hypothetical protein